MENRIKQVTNVGLSDEQTIVRTTNDYDPEEDMLDVNSLAHGLGLLSISCDDSEIKVKLSDLKPLVKACAGLASIIGNNLDILDEKEACYFDEAIDVCRLVGNKYLKGTDLRREEQKQFDFAKKAQSKASANNDSRKKIEALAYGFYGNKKDVRKFFLEYVDEQLDGFYKRSKFFNPESLF